MGGIESAAGSLSLGTLESSQIRTFKSAVCDVAPESRHISFVNGHAFTEGRERFLLGFVRHPSWETGGFVKAAVLGSEPANELKRESDATLFARRLGIPSVRVLREYTETGEGLGVVVFERLLKRRHRLFVSKKQLKNVHPNVGRVVAGAFIRDALKVVPPDEDSAFLVRSDQRNAGAKGFVSLWGTLERSVFGTRLPASYLGSVIEAGKLRRILARIRHHVMDEIELADTSVTEKFVHNDYALTNLGMTRRVQPVLSEVTVLDYEHAGATRNAVLALITDIADFYRSCSTNNELRMQFIVTIMDKWRQSQIERAQDILSAAIAFGTLLHGGSKRNRLDPEHPEHGEAADLITSLENNLQRVQMHRELVW